MSDKITNEIHELLNAKVVSAETAQRIRDYFHQKKKENYNRLFSVFGILGAVLVGLGIILVFAHNWDTLSRLTRVILSFLPLLIGQIFCGCSLLKNPQVRFGEKQHPFLYSLPSALAFH